MMSKNKQASVIILGAGPTGLAQAIALHQAMPDIKITIIDQQSETTLANSVFDGRAIALNQSSKTFLTLLGVWALIDSKEIHPLKDAKVSDGKNPYALHFERSDDHQAPLGYFVRNAVIKKALYQRIQKIKNINWQLEQRVTHIQNTENQTSITLNNQQTLSADLLIAADGRFSYARKMLGIGAKIKDFGRIMMVFEVSHTSEHHQTAHEHFLYNQATCAVLPLNNKHASIVLTLPKHRADELDQANNQTVERFVEATLKSKLGKVTLASEKHGYPLIGSYANQFITSRCAFIGDAAVGMHPVTAHGFNLGLKSINCLTQAIQTAYDNKNSQNDQTDIGTEAILKNYQNQYRLISTVMYHGTNAIVDLYTNEKAQSLRGFGLRLGNALPLVKQLIVKQLTKTE